MAISTARLLGHSQIVASSSRPFTDTVLTLRGEAGGVMSGAMGGSDETTRLHASMDILRYVPSVGIEESETSTNSSSSKLDEQD